MPQVDIRIPEAVLYDTRMSLEDALAFARRAVAAEFYRQRGVSVGYCAQIAGMPKEDFIKYLGKRKISIFHYASEEEFLRELENA